MSTPTHGGKRPNSGRKAPAGVRKNITLRLSQSELDTIKTAAKSTGEKISEYIRRKALNMKEVVKMQYWKKETEAGTWLLVQKGFEWGNDLLCAEDGVWGTYCPMSDDEHIARGYTNITRQEAEALAELAGYDEIIPE